MTRLKVKKEFGEFYYNIIKANCTNELDADIYELYDKNHNFIANFGSYGDLKYYVETGIIL